MRRMAIDSRCSVDGKGPQVPMGAAHPDRTDGATVALVARRNRILADLQGRQDDLALCGDVTNRHGDDGLDGWRARRRSDLAASRAVRAHARRLAVVLCLAAIAAAARSAAAATAGFLALGPVELLLDRRLRETQLEQGLLGGDDHVRVTAEVGDRVVGFQPEIREDRCHDRFRATGSPRPAGIGRIVGRDTVGTNVTG